MFLLIQLWSRRGSTEIARVVLPDIAETYGYLRLRAQEGYTIRVVSQDPGEYVTQFDYRGRYDAITGREL